MLTKWLISRRMSWVPATEPRDCGAAAFASVARYYRYHVTLEQARALAGTDQNGTTLAGLRNGGRMIGLEARPAEAIYSALQHITVPSILHMHEGEGHFLVLCRWMPDALVVLDPNCGIRTLSRSAFEAEWSGYLVEYRPTPALQPKEPDFAPLTSFLRLAWQHTGSLGFVLLWSLLATSLGWVSSFFLQILVDHILPHRETGLLIALGAGLLLVGGLQALLRFGQLRLAASIGQRVHRDYGVQYIKQLLRLPINVFDVRCTAGFVMRINQVESIQFSLTESGVLLLTDSLMFLAALGVILFYDPWAALIAGSAVPSILIITLLLNNRVYYAHFASVVRLEEFASKMIDTFEVLRTIKIFGAERRYQQLLEEKFDHLVKARFDLRQSQALPATWSWLAAALVTGGILWYGGNSVIGGQITIGQLLVLFGMVSFYLIPVQRFPDTLLAIRASLIDLERLEEIHLLPAEQDRTVNPRSLPSVQGRIEFKQVSFGYKRERPVLKNINLTIEAGEIVAIVGETGSGKTTLANLIAGFYLPTEGDVLIDDVSTHDLIPEELRQAISTVFQEGRLLQQSVRDNITLMSDAPLPAIRRAAQLANADEFITSLLRGYDTAVMHGSLSSGQIQRIALARALLKDAPILLLDEATSNLDGATEQGILQALSTNRQGRTTVVIAHRLSTVALADRIFVMHNGELVEMGTHDELWKHQGRYAALFQGQIVAQMVPEGAQT